MQDIRIEISDEFNDKPMEKCDRDEMRRNEKEDILNFRAIRLEDLPRINTYIASQPYRICDYTIGVLYMWRDFLNYEYAVKNGMLVIRSCLNATMTFSIPLGEGDLDKALDAIEAFCAQNGYPLNFHGVTWEAVKLLVDKFGDRFKITEMVSWGEYLYNFSDLLYLTGKKYHGKRNHINQFNRLYPQAVFKEITLESLPKIEAFLKRYYIQTEKEQQLFNVEKEMLKKVFRSYAELKAQGGYIEVDGEVAAFAIGETQGDIIYVHIEKADTNYKGSYAAINNEYLKYFAAEGINFVNREEDVGDPGLRKAKLSYYPVEIIKKYSVREKNIRKA
jgi:hypothetical protein